MRCSREGDREGTLDVLNSMGLAIPIAAGHAMGSPKRTWVVEGDGGLLMGMNVLATLGMLALPRLAAIVLDNGAHCSTGCQPTAASVVDLGEIAAGAGLDVHRAKTEPELEAALSAASTAERTVFVHVAITTESASGVPYLQPDPAGIADRLQRHLAYLASRAQRGISPVRRPPMLDIRDTSGARDPSLRSG